MKPQGFRIYVASDKWRMETELVDTQLGALLRLLLGSFALLLNKYLVFECSQTAMNECCPCY